MKGINFYTFARPLIGEIFKPLYAISMKCSELLRLLLKAGWRVESQRGSHVKLVHPERYGFIIFPNHGSNEMGKGLEKKIRKQAGL